VSLFVPIVVSFITRPTADFSRAHSYDILEGTEQIQQLVIARAVSGMGIE
jgi:alkylation response protein AidB-like acyl-CoA dehydrogenase